MTVLILLYLFFAASFVVPARRIAYRDFGWFGGYSGGVVLGLCWPLMLRSTVLHRLAHI